MKGTGELGNYDRFHIRVTVGAVVKENYCSFGSSPK